MGACSQRTLLPTQLSARWLPNSTRTSLQTYSHTPYLVTTILTLPSPPHHIIKAFLSLTELVNNLSFGTHGCLLAHVRRAAIAQ